MNVDSVSVNNYPFNKVDIALINNDPLVSNSFPVVYILYDPKNMIAYVGESTNVINRMNNHLTHPEKKNLKLVYFCILDKVCLFDPSRNTLLHKLYIEFFFLYSSYFNTIADTSSPLPRFMASSHNNFALLE